MKILSVGNSFSQDATRYLSGIARAGGVPMRTVNLMIGGCSLARHYRNMLAEDRVYTFEQNGVSTQLAVSLKEALLSDFFDVVTVQQLSSEAPRYATYQPYLDELCGYIRRCQPRARLFFHETWPYERGSARLMTELQYSDEASMYADLHGAAEMAAEAMRALGILPSGRAFLEARALGAESLHRDTYHASLGFGRYLLGLVWFGALTGRDFRDNGFRDFDLPLTEQEVAMAKEAASRALAAYGYLPAKRHAAEK